MILGFALSKAQSLEDLRCLGRLREAQCQRIVLVEPSQRQRLLLAVLRRLRPGDTLVIDALPAIATSVGDLVELAVGLEARGIQLKSLEEGLDTHDREKVAETLARLRSLGNASG
jgi:DNA invertase Pin-like site-specific DNA recombinase